MSQSQVPTTCRLNRARDAVLNLPAEEAMQHDPVVTEKSHQARCPSYDDEPDLGPGPVRMSLTSVLPFRARAPPVTLAV